MSRPRVVVTPKDFSRVLKPFVTLRSWLVYEESAKVSETNQHKGDVFKHVAQRLSSSWWSNSGRLTNRLQNLCRTVSQSLRKNPSSEFAATFQWSPTTTDTAAELGYTVVCGRGLRLAWLCLQDGTKLAEMLSSIFFQPTHRWHAGPTGPSTQ